MSMGLMNFYLQQFELWKKFPDYFWITDPYIVKVIQNINEKFPPSLYPITDKDILEERLVKCGFYDLNLKRASEDWMRWVKTEIFMYFKKEKGGE